MTNVLLEYWTCVHLQQLLCNYYNTLHNKSLRITSNIINIVGEGDKAKMAEMAETAETDNKHHICDEQNHI